MGTLPQALCFSGKKGPIFLEALDLWVRCRRRLFFRQKRGPIFFGTDPPDLGTDHEGMARKYLARHGIMRARHGNIWHGTDPPGHGTEIFGTARIHQILARHGTGRPCTTLQCTLTLQHKTIYQELKAQGRAFTRPLPLLPHIHKV